VSDLTDVSIWRGRVRVAFVIDRFTCRFVGWRVPTTTPSAFMLDA